MTSGGHLLAASSVVTMLTVVAAMENCVNIRPSRLMPCSRKQGQHKAGRCHCVSHQ